MQKKIFQINNCSPGGSGSVTLSRPSRSLSLSELSPLHIFRRKSTKDAEFNLLVSSGELIVEAEHVKNHLMSSYKLEKYSYSQPKDEVFEKKRTRKMAVVNEAINGFARCLMLIFMVFLHF